MEHEVNNQEGEWDKCFVILSLNTNQQRDWGLARGRINFFKHIAYYVLIKV
jgi:hypothetical protein